MAERRLIIPYRPRAQFQPYHTRRQRWSLGVAHRRAGKTVATVNDKIIRCLHAPRPDWRAAYMAPSYRQAKRISWDYVKHFSAAVPGVEFHEAELRVDYPNGARLSLYGADNYDALRGVYLDDVALDEYGDMDPRVWPEVIRPALSDRKGSADFIGTARGRNHFYDLREIARFDPKGWFYYELRASQTGIIDAEELADARQSMSEDQYLQEYECSFDAALVGSYYGKAIAGLEADNRIGMRSLYDSALPVYTAWDLGVGDSTVIWFAQLSGREIRLIDHYANSGVGIDHYVKIIKEKPYAYELHILPHDAKQKQHGVPGARTREDQLREFGIGRLKVLEQQSIEDGINAARRILSRCYFDEKVRTGVEALKMYRKEFDEKRKVFHDRPLHDWSSDHADAFRYLALGIPDKPQGPRADWDKPLAAPLGTIA